MDEYIEKHLIDILNAATEVESYFADAPCYNVHVVETSFRGCLFLFLSIKKAIFMDTRLKMMCVSINKAVFMDGPIDGRLSVACAVVNN